MMPRRLGAATELSHSKRIMVDETSPWDRCLNVLGRLSSSVDILYGAMAAPLSS